MSHQVTSTQQIDKKKQSSLQVNKNKIYETSSNKSIFRGVYETSKWVKMTTTNNIGQKHEYRKGIAIRFNIPKSTAKLKHLATTNTPDIPHPAQFDRDKRRCLNYRT